MTLDSRLPNDRGSGLLSMVSGVLMFTAFLLFAVQVLFSLYATSVVTDAAYDAARTVAATGRDATNETVQADAEAEMRRRLGDYAASGRLDANWTVTADNVALRVTAPNPRIMPASWMGALPFASVDRTVTVRVEEFR